MRSALPSSVISSRTTSRAHVDRDRRDAAPLAAQVARDQSARRLHREDVARHATLLREPAGEDAKAVAALLGFAAVGIEDAEARVGVRRGDQRQDSVAADAAMAVAEGTDGAGGEAEGEGRGVDHQVVVAEPVALAKGVRHAVQRMP
jgi:hypothetical protein